MPALSKCQELLGAVFANNASAVEKLLRDPETDPGDEIIGDSTPFSTACKYNKIEIVRLFLACKKPFDYNHQPQNKFSPLQYAAFWGNHETLRLLVDDPRIDVNVLTRGKLTTLSLARDSPLCMKIILASDRFTQVHTPDKDGETVLQRAIRFGKRGIVDIIEAYIKDPVATRKQLRKELGGYPEHNAGELFAIGVLLCDGYLSLA